MDYDVDDAKALADSIGNRRAASGTGYVCSDEHLIGSILDPRSRRSQDFDTSVLQTGHNSFADTLGAAGDERATAVELEITAHWRISSDAILSPSISKM